jgi:hypothetical protein
MKRILLWSLLVPIAALAAAALSGCASSTPFASQNEPHATLVLNGSPRARDLYPVRVQAVDGHLTTRESLPVLQFKPGRYKLKLRPVNIHHMENLPGTVAGKSEKRTQDTLTVTLDAGKTYYIAARISKNGNWHPVIWKTND